MTIAAMMMSTELQTSSHFMQPMCEILDAAEILGVPTLMGQSSMVREEEPQRRHDAVHCRSRNTGLALLDLEAAQVLRRGRAGGERR